MNRINLPSTALRTLLLICALISSSFLNIHAQKQKKEKKNIFYIYLHDMFTDDAVGDTISVELLRPDSTLITTQRSDIIKDELGRPKYNHVSFNRTGQDFIVRLSHPDYETILHPIHYKGNSRFDLPIRKLTKSEKAIMLGEVTVTASKLEFINKGDTIQFNADAFELAEGSMLSALIKRLPGAELKENGQIFVNGKFVDKLLLDGKDFFKNDKLVLLQNLPAYTVKNIQVYEEKLPEQLAKKEGANPDYVMDVKLKKEFNAGWMANAEAGGGTHSRYRLRGFGMMYNQKNRFAAYALMNNLNETGATDMSGGWQNTNNNRGQIITKGGGLDYNIQPKKGMEFSGSATAQYQTAFNNIITNRQNYIPQGDNYTRRWDDSRFGNLKVDTRHHTRIDTKKGTHEADATFNYGDDKTRSETTEGTFGMMPGDSPSLRDELKAGMPASYNILNRYLNATSSNTKRADGGLNYNWFRFYDESRIQMMSLNAWGNLNHRWQKGFDQYLLQYAAESALRTNRENPQSSHGYKYGGSYRIFLGSYDKNAVSLTYKIENSYSRSNTMLYDILDRESPTSDNPLQQWLRIEQLRRELDAKNSYLYGMHSLEQTMSVGYQFDKKERDDRGWTLSQFRINIDPEVRYLRRSMNFSGFDSQLLKRNTWLPGARFIIFYHKSNKSGIDFSYNLKSTAPEMMDMLNISFDSDPMNPTVGNPNLKYGFSHNFNLTYNSFHYFWNKLYVIAWANYQTIQNMISYATSFDMATGIRTTMPMNINGNRNAQFSLQLFYRPCKRFNFTNSLTYRPARFANYISTSDMQGMKKSISNRNRWDEILEAEFQSKIFVIGAKISYLNQRAMSRTQDFKDYTTQCLIYGLRGLVRLPYNFEISTNLSMEKNFGYTDPEFNKGQLIWNARISKSVMGGSLQFAFDGYDMLNQVKRTNVDITSAYRLEERYNSVPSYFMFTIKYFFSKKPRQ